MIPTLSLDFVAVVVVMTIHLSKKKRNEKQCKDFILCVAFNLFERLSKQQHYISQKYGGQKKVHVHCKRDTHTHT